MTKWEARTEYEQPFAEEFLTTLAENGSLDKFISAYDPKASAYGIREFAKTLFGDCSPFKTEEDK